jgi:hypothetical protein
MSLSPSNFDITQQLPISKITKPVGPPKHRFNQFSLEYSRLLNDDYVHGKFLTLKYAGKGQSFNFSGKGTLDFKAAGSDKKEVPVTSSEVKLLTNIEGKNVEAKFDNKGGIRLWGNFGLYTLWKPVVITAKLKTKNDFDKASGNVCFEHQAKQSNVQLRLDVKNDRTPYLNSRAVFNDGKYQFGFAAKVNLLSYALARYNLYVGYREKDLHLFVEHTSKSKNKIELGKLTAGGIYKTAKHDYVGKASYRPQKPENPLMFKLGTVVNVNKNNVVRAKVNSKGKLTLSSKFKYNSNLTLVAGTRIDLLNPASYVTKKTVPIPFGLSVELSYD